MIALGRLKPLDRCEPTEIELQRLSGPKYEKRIFGEWRQSANHVLACARWCARAAKFLSAEDLKSLKAQLPFDPSEFSKLKSIGNDERLYDTRICPLLPPHMSLLFDYHLLGDEALESAVTIGASRASLPEEMVGPPTAASRQTPHQKMIGLGEVRVPSSTTDKEVEKLRRAVKKLGGTFLDSLSRDVSDETK